MEKIDHSLANKLLEMAEADRSMRTNFLDSNADWDSSVDEDNQTQLMEIVKETGWPIISKIGSEASRAAWLIVQHASNLEFMEYCLGLMEVLPASEIDPANVAYLKDRVLMMNGKPQVYGTQYQGIGNDMQLWPIDDMEHVDERRASLGLDSIVENEARLRRRNKITP
ncbi:MAG: DUF6624 domain-containing protein [Candidatus Microsaccharimonas sp.]